MQLFIPPRLLPPRASRPGPHPKTRASPGTRPLSWLKKELSPPVSMAIVTVVVAALLVVSGVHCIDNGLGRTPQMGYNSWYDLTCSSAMNEDVLKATASAMKSKGLASLGYE